MDQREKLLGEVMICSICDRVLHGGGNWVRLKVPQKTALLDDSAWLSPAICPDCSQRLPIQKASLAAGQR